MTANQRPVIAWERFTDTQRRRAEALLLVAIVFPVATTGASQRQLADWIIYGKRGGAS